ncbi:MAG: MFS transporter [Proteobacteria bacterium]|nr:MFS transporter [Pseudomonadota bacterium]
MTLTPMVRAVAGLGFTQIVGWGTTFLMPSVLGRHIQDDLHVPTEIVFAGITVLFAVGAVLAPHVGRRIDRTGPRLIMTAGSIVYGLSLLATSLSQGPVVYLLSWAGMGVASTLALSVPSSIAMAQIAGSRARQGISMLTIIGGFASTAFWPLSGAIDAMVGWRGTLMIYAAVHIFACAPIHFFMLPKSAPVLPQGIAGTPAVGGVPAELRPRAYRLLSISLCFGAFVFTGMIVYMIEVLRALGHAPASAVFLGSMVGPAQVGIRAFELLFGHRYSIMNSAVFGSALLPFCLVLAMMGGDNFGLALVCMLAYGISNGLKAVQRATLPLAIFGRGQFGAYMGRLALPQGIASAAAPVVLATVLDRFGAEGVLGICLVLGTISLVAMVMLARMARSVR